ncbi:hypothetical protein LCGC14_2194820 [marine sediment metagenome]|uniref:Uncharacterized protein n=1 Tax=marine sediment metagenome TaxID=412755 RepID=A0A0F9FVW5_9ZZZZ
MWHNSKSDHYKNMEINFNRRKYNRCLKIISDGKVLMPPSHQYSDDLAACNWDMCGWAEKCKLNKLEHLRQGNDPNPPKKKAETEMRSKFKRKNKQPKKEIKIENKNRLKGFL